MIGLARPVRREAVTAAVRPVHRVALGLIANYGLVPAVTVGLLYRKLARRALKDKPQLLEKLGIKA